MDKLFELAITILEKLNINVRTMMQFLFTLIFSIFIYFFKVEGYRDLDGLSNFKGFSLKSGFQILTIFTLFYLLFYWILAYFLRLISHGICLILVFLTKILFLSPSIYKTVSGILNKILTSYVKILTPKTTETNEIHNRNFHSQKIENAISGFLITFQISILYWFYFSKELGTLQYLDFYIKLIIIVFLLYFQYLSINYFFLFNYNQKLKKMIERFTKIEI